VVVVGEVGAAVVVLVVCAEVAAAQESGGEVASPVPVPVLGQLSSSDRLGQSAIPLQTSDCSMQRYSVQVNCDGPQKKGTATSRKIINVMKTIEFPTKSFT
jgi:hypothetical protein